MESVCCGCRKETSNDNSKNIFKDELNVYDNDSVSSEQGKDPKSMRNIKLCTGMEIITGHKISKLDIKSTNLCNGCFGKIESYINFRTELLMSLGTLISESSNNSVIDPKIKSSSSDVENPESENVDFLPGVLTPEESINMDTSKTDDANDEKIFQMEREEDTANVETLVQNFDIVSQVECDTTDFLDMGKIENEENEQNEENGHDDPDNSNDFLNMDIPERFMQKVQDTDIESEINICSSEDDEIVELDIQCRKYDTIQIDSSSESDVEVCDYKPAGKKMKYCNTLSPPILF